jgi:AcrR family transcriptional regulator
MAKRDRKADIMRAAEKLFTARRYHEISLDDVVAEAHVGKGTIYRYFRNKEDLFFQVAQSGFEELCEMLQSDVPVDAPFSKQVLCACRKISGFFGRRRQLFRMMQTEHARMFWRRGDARQRWRERRGRLVDAIAGIIRKGVDEGVVRSDIAPEVLARYLLGTLRTRTWTSTEAADHPETLESVIDLFLHGALGGAVSAGGGA